MSHLAPAAPDIDALRAALQARVDPERRAPMAAYMQDRFPFLGVRSPDRAEAQRATVAACAGLPTHRQLAFVDACWAQSEREFQYVGAHVLRRGSAAFELNHIEDLARYLTTKSWWDTVDALAIHPLGRLVRTYPILGTTMDRWIDANDRWLVRAAILHQLRYRTATDADRLFGYARRRGEDPDFFVRKALGWALRQYGQHAPDDVRRFVADHAHALSPLTRREALRRLPSQ